jgi:hypothetical protein
MLHALLEAGFWVAQYGQTIIEIFSKNTVEGGYRVEAQHKDS